MTNTQRLLQLTAENPDLPIVPMVDYDVVGDGYGFWLGEFGHCEVGEYTLYKERYYDDREEFNDAYYCDNGEAFDGLSDQQIDETIKAATDHMWTKAIIVYIRA
jgi:hypothetical protein